MSKNHKNNNDNNDNDKTRMIKTSENVIFFLFKVVICIKKKDENTYTITGY